MSVPAVIHKLSKDQIDIIKSQIFRNATDDELKFFIYHCERTGLDPIAKQIYCRKQWNKKENKNDIIIITGIDGYRLIANRTGQYAGNDDPVFDNEENPSRAFVNVYKLVGGVRCAFGSSARWAQYYPGDDKGFMWRKMPHLMLGKCAEALALRKAFPAELSGVYTEEEMHQANLEPDVIQTQNSSDQQPLKVVSAPKVTTTNQSKDTRPPTEPQIRRLFGLCKQNKVQEHDLRSYMDTHLGKKSTSELTRDEYQSLCTLIESGMINKQDILRGDDVPFA